MPEPLTVCPECRQGKHVNCTHIADYEADDTPIDCACGCVESRTWPTDHADGSE